MATSTGDARAWERLGAQLVQRRTGLDPRYRNRRLFCEERSLDYRLIYDIENARRTNFGAATLAVIEIGYAVEHGSIDVALSGGDLIPAGDGDAPSRSAGSSRPPVSEGDALRPALPPPPVLPKPLLIEDPPGDRAEELAIRELIDMAGADGHLKPWRQRREFILGWLHRDDARRDNGSRSA
jgi:hypothetical protein